MMYDDICKGVNDSNTGMIGRFEPALCAKSMEKYELGALVVS